jgi:Tn3 transposase DDE domain
MSEQPCPAMTEATAALSTEAVLSQFAPAVAAHPRPRQDHLGPRRHPCRDHQAVPARRAATGARWSEDLAGGCWPDLLRVAGSLKYGQATASLVVVKWPAASRQNTLAAGLKERGTSRRTIHAAKYLSDPVYRRKIARTLKGRESLWGLEVRDDAVTLSADWS